MASGNISREPWREAVRWQALLDAITDTAAYMLDPNGVIISWNAGAERITGYAAEEIIGEHVSRLFIPQDRERGEPERMLRLAHETGRWQEEAPRSRRDGTHFRASIVSQPLYQGDRHIGFAQIMRDLTAPGLARQALTESERHFQMLVQGVVDYAIFMMDPTGQVTTWNSGAQRIKGYKPHEIIGRHFSTFYSEEDRRAGIPQSSLAKAAREGKVELEGWRIRKDGSRFFASVVIDAIRDAAGELIGFAKVTRDITERKSAEERLEAVRAAFLQAQKMEALGQLTGGIAHDFNNLLTVVLNNADLLSVPVLGDQQRTRLVDGIQRAATRGARLTQQLLAFARRQPLRPKPHRINSVIAGFDTVLRRGCGGNCELNLDLAAVPDTANIDAAQFEAALLNVVVNSRDAMQDGGAITIRTSVENIGTERAPSMEGVRPGLHVVVSVSDNGAGMPPDVVHRAFEPFFTTKEPGKGSGLGLSQVFGFVKQSGGHVEIESAVGAGTTVRLYLPAARGIGEDAAEDALASAQPGGSGRVLIVEDDSDVLEAAVVAVESLGYDVLTARDGPSALKLLERDERVDVLFSDIVMPKGLSGLQLAREARRLRPGLKVLLASGYPTAVLAQDQGPADEFAFIGKPYRRDELAEKLAMLQGERATPPPP